MWQERAFQGQGVVRAVMGVLDVEGRAQAPRVRVHVLSGLP